MNLLSLREAFTPAYKPFRPTKDDMNRFRKALHNFLNNINVDKWEEHNKNFIAPFLREFAYQDSKYKINTDENIDLAISKDGYVEVLIEAKRPYSKKNSVPEMVKQNDMNKKAFRETLLYYMRQVDSTYGDGNNPYIKHIIITNTIEWYIIDKQYYATIAKHPEIKKAYKELNSDEFYKKSEGIIQTYDLLKNLKFVYIDLSQKHTELELKNIYKIFTPRHLLKELGANDSNTLNKKFYNELLHIIGLEEVGKGKKLIQRKSVKSRESGSLLENTIRKLETEFGINDEKKLFENALELNITWLNRILFLQLLDSHLHFINGESYQRFISSKSIANYDVLNTLFFEVLSIKVGDRKKDIIVKFPDIPYLNSSLFEATNLEQTTLRISGLKDDVTMSVLSSSKTNLDKTKEHNTLEYLITFLDSYDFSSDQSKILKSDTDSLINASVLGLIFEKINGYKDGSFFTPSFITMYMVKESIRNTVVAKFNEELDFNAESIEDVKTNLVIHKLYNKIGIEQSNRIINQITILDPAVGSGHFLVSALNELLVIKSELKLLKGLEFYDISIVDDELLVLDSNDEVFQYKINRKGQIPKEKESIQKKIFHEKQQIIENQLFGVDINPNSVKITRLRLWIELLKNSYYENDELVTLPNIDINIKCGNSLISRFSLIDEDNDKGTARKILSKKLPEYKSLISQYINEKNKESKQKIRQKIDEIQLSFTETLEDTGKFMTSLKNYVQDYRFRGLPKELIVMAVEREFGTQNALPYNSDEIEPANEKSREKSLKKLKSLYEKNIFYSSELYQNAFEWRFRFPEVLNSNGDFEGFDIVIENPPWGATMTKFEKKYLKEKYTTIDSSTPNTFAYFVGLSYNLSKSIIALVLPDSILVKDFQKTRKLIKNNFSNIAWYQNTGIKDNIRPFIDVEHDVCIIFINKLINYKKATITKRKIINKRLINKTFELEKENFIFDKYDNVFNISLDATKSIIAHKYINISTLGEIMQCHEGIHSGNIREKLFTKHPSITDAKKMFLGAKNGDKIDNYISNMSGWYVEYNKNKIDNSKGEYASLRDVKLFINPKIYITRTGNPLKAFIDNNNFASNNFFSLQFKNYDQNTMDNLKTVLALINSKFANFYIRQIIAPSLGDIFIETKIIHIMKLPFVDSILTSEKLKILIDQVIQFKKQNRDTAELEDKIDEKVYELYGLTGEEINTIDPKPNQS